MDSDRKRMLFDATAWAVGLLVALTVVGREALAEDHRFPVTSPVYKTECATCHVAYPPALLPSASWRAILDGLDKHFGTNASVDAKSLAELRSFLDANAGGDRRASAGAPRLRITETDWFRREHREVPAATWKSPTVKSPANCTACHAGAESGDYGERGIRVPK